MLEKINKNKILVVDNNPVLLKLMTTLLADQEGHQVRTASHGLEALDVLKSFTPDIIFVDLIMPKIGGAELCRIIRSMPELKDVLLVILSAIAKESQEDLPPPADICIAKGPFSTTAKHVLHAVEWVGMEKLPGSKLRRLGFEDAFQREATTELLCWKKHFEVILNNMSEAIFEITSDWRIVYANPKGINLLAHREEELLGASLPSFFKDADNERVKKLLLKVEDKSPANSGPEPVLIYDRQVTLHCLLLEESAHKSIIVIIRDITERCLAEEKLRLISITDELTGLLNRRGFMAMAGKQFQIAERVKDGIYLIFADLDDLKKINDKYGHKAGDRAIIMLADVLRQSFRQSDIVGRLGGDEFAVLTTSNFSSAKKEGMCERFFEALALANMDSSLGFEVAISAGIARYDPLNPCSLEELISRADFQMYECKKNKNVQH